MTSKTFDTPLMLEILGTLHRLGHATLRELAAELDHENTDKVRITLGRLLQSRIVHIRESAGDADFWALTDEGEAARQRLLGVIETGRRA